MQRDTAQQLETALAVAQGASVYLSQNTRVAADNAAAEIQAGDTLQVTPHLHHNFEKLQALRSGSMIILSIDASCCA